ncbi:MAG: MmgE/PrpD family protein [Pseudomonadota bacterium]|nr:MmgE/PrpD family protein [Pseudomonadota bacterium]
MTGQEKSVSESISEFVHNFPSNNIPNKIVEHAKLCILDAVGIAFASRTYDFSKSVLQTMSELGGGGNSPVIGQAETLPLRDAVFCNAALIHGLDYDDTHLDSVVHCSASHWPVAFNLGIATRQSGIDILTAYILGIEVTARIGIVTEGQLQKNGHHPTGVIGAFGCVVTASYLSKLNPSQITNAIGIVLSMASGNMEFVSEGAWTKRIHPSWAAVAGITAVALAKNDFVGPKKALEGKYGLFNILLGQNEKNRITQLVKTLGEDWETLGSAIKPYPACHFNHAFADCALEIKKENNLQLESITKIIALVHKDQVPIVCEPEDQKRKPNTPYEAQFSIPYIVAAVLVHGRFTLKELTPTALKNRKVSSLCSKIHYSITERSYYPKSFSGALVVETSNGKQYEKTIKYNRGSKENPLTKAEIKEKFLTNCSLSITPHASEQVYKELSKLDVATDASSLAKSLSYQK